MSACGVELSDAQLQRLADLLAPRIVAALQARPVVAQSLIDANEVAQRFGMSAEWVRDHSSELGAIRLGDGPRPRLRFDAETVAKAMKRRSESGRSPEPELPMLADDRPHRVSERAGNGLETLPVRQIAPLSLSATSTKAARRRANAPGPATRGIASPRQQPTRAAAGRPAPRRTNREERA